MKEDSELVQEVRNGNSSSFSELVRRHQKSLVRLLLRMTRDLETAEEIVQESFIKAFQKIDSFENRSSFKSWLYQIALNTGRNSLRSNKSPKASLEQVHLSVGSTAHSKVIKQSISKTLNDLIAELPDRQKTSLVLRIYDDLSFAEIAEIMQCPYDTAKANYRHGLIKLKDALQDSDLLAEWISAEEDEADKITEAFKEADS